MAFTCFHRSSVVALSILCYFLIFSTESTAVSGNIVLSQGGRSPRQASGSTGLVYDQELTRSQPVPENADSTTPLYDLKSVSINNQPSQAYSFKVITNADSRPEVDSLFIIDAQKILRLGYTFSQAERKNKYFDYEQYPVVVVIVEATPSNPNSTDKKYIKISIPLSDVNDEFPVLKNKPQPYYAAMPMAPESGYTVYVLLAEDPDTTSDIDYAIDESAVGGQEAKRLFRMVRVEEKRGTPDRIVEGHIKLIERNAFTVGQSYDIPVIIRDRQVVSQVTRAVVNVLVGPRAPQFYQTNYEGWIFETPGTNKPVYTMSGGNRDKLTVQVHQFQKNYPIAFKIVEDNNRESTRFRISQEGHILNKDALDYDILPVSQRPPKFRLTIKAIETSDTGVLEGNATLEITIMDENDNPPRFKSTQYMAPATREDLPIGSSVLEVLAEDLDSDQNGEVTYSVDSPYFGVRKEDKKGVIFVKSNLDYDAPPGPTYRFVVVAKDNGAPALSSSVDVIVTTTNVNDEKPKIIPSGVLVLRDQVPANFTLTRLRATDADGDNVKFYFTPLAMRYEIFSIKPSSGIIQVVGSVPSNINSYILNITAIDDGSCCGGSPQLTSSATVVVEIVDSVNQKPTFNTCLEYSQTAKFDEESPEGTPVIKVSATDPDRGLNGIVSYTIESTSPSPVVPFFNINSSTGQITINTPVDREALGKDFIQVTVKGSDKAQTPQEGWCTFRVAVNDINDNAPVFNSLSYSETISSNIQVNRVILRVGATDRDIGLNAKISYSFDNDGNGVFGIYEENGLIYLKSPLAASVREYNLVVKARDHGTPPKSVTVNVKISVATGTSDPPKFNSDPTSFNFTYKISEVVAPNSAEANLTTLSCNSNTPNNTRVQYFLVDSRGVLQPQQAGSFAISERQANNQYLVDIIVAQPLDYEKVKQYSVILRCQNFGGLTMYDQITLTINVEDKNNKVPYFEGMGANGRYSGSVPENTDPGALVIEVQGYDDDFSVAFRLLNFSLSRENDAKVMEGFAIQNVAGNKAKITTRKQFDRETDPRFFITVVADDKSPSDRPNHRPQGTPNSASVVVVVDITDKNDNPMTFKQSSYTHTVPETASIGTVIFAVTADDKDEVDQGRLKYSFTNNEEIPFDIRDQTGEIIVNGKLDYEGPKKSYVLFLESRDSDNYFSASTTVTINVQDENDNIPVFESAEYVIDKKVVEEDSSVTKERPKELVTVRATDADTARTINMRYRLLGEGTEPGDKQKFTINEKTGQVFLVAALDRDAPRGKSEFIFTVEALDEDEDPQKGYTNIKVKPLDINDNYPVFNIERLSGEVLEHSQPGWFSPNRDNVPPVAVVLATDVDYKENATLTYSIVAGPTTKDGGSGSGGSMNYFNIDDNGRIFSQVDAIYLDREKSPRLEVTVVAMDQSIEPKSSTATVTITLKDINDNAPVFTQKEYNVTMSEHLESGIVTEVYATDKDENDNAELQFSMSASSAAGGHFKVDTIENKGVIQIYEPVDYEKLTSPVFELEIIVQDKDPKHRDTAIVRITVEDFNDNAPVFRDAYKQIEIEENKTPGDLVATFIATDADSGINAQFSYLIDRDSDRRREFVIDSSTGQVKTRKMLDRELEERMTIIIKAVDKGDPRQTGTATLAVRVQDVNDNYPIFLEDYRPVIPENLNNAKYPLKVIEVFARDLDTPINGPPFGFALPANCQILACQKFSLVFNETTDNGQGTATIYTNSVFDREEHKYYELPIVMWDMRGSNNPKAQTGTNTLTITIGDVNDNPHFSGHQDIFVYNYKGLFGPVVIGRVYVQDLDDWDLPNKTFTFSSPATMQNFFSVDSGTGDITMKKGVRANFGEAPYDFKVDVYDKVFQKTVTSTVSVVVKDIGEEAVLNSGAVRLSDMTAEKFITAKKDPRTGRTSDSLYTQFRLLMAQKLGYPKIDNVEVISLRDGDGYLEVRYAAHASPYISGAQVDNAIIMNAAEFESLGLKIKSIPVDECEDEIFEGGCYNKLVVTDKPVTINGNGTSFVGVDAYLVATPGCSADTLLDTNNCRGDYCYNGGVCKKDDWGMLSCECKPEFDGPRCQQRRHFFDGNSVAMYQTLGQCEESQTSIEFITDKDDGIILYNGPLININPLETPQDFMLLELKGGFPVLLIDHGTGSATLTLTGKDQHGTQLMHKLSDGKWHQIDINRNGKEVELVVDKCKYAENSGNFVSDDIACRVKKETPGENMYLNVNTHLHMGGIQTSVVLKHLGNRPIVGFKGCMKNLVHNKQLYDLYFKPMPGLNTGKNGCPTEDTYCTDNKGASVCGPHGICQATLSGDFTCRCQPMWYGRTCNKPATVRDLQVNSLYVWEMKEVLFNSQQMTRNREMSTQIMFRTRQSSGILLDFQDSASTDSTLHIRLVLNDGKVRLIYNLGGGEKYLDLTYVPANNGQWHVLTMERYGREFHLRLDGGEGKNYNYTLKSTSNKERDVFKVNRRVSCGAYRQVIGVQPVLTQDLIKTCIQDIRVNNHYFPMTEVESEDPDTYAKVEISSNTKEGCVRDDCKPGVCPINRVCTPLWDHYECRCEPGYTLEGDKCVSSCNPNPCFNNVSCSIVNSVVSCKCPTGWRGRLCDELAPQEVKSGDLSDGAIIAIIVSIIIVILLAMLVFLLYRFCPRGEEGEKYILEVDPEDDIRENVMNYDEEGAGEEDQDGYDISKLQRPNYETPMQPMQQLKRRYPGLGNAPGDKPDVGNFIEDRMKDADNDDGAPPYDSVREFNFEGGSSDAGSLSSLNTSSSDRSQDYDYLNDWGPKFAKLADMYGAGQDLEQE